MLSAQQFTVARAQIASTDGHQVQCANLKKFGPSLPAEIWFDWETFAPSLCCLAEVQIQE